MTLMQPWALTVLGAAPAMTVQPPSADANGCVNVLTLPLPETMFGDVLDLTALQCRLQRIAVVNALSVTVARVRALLAALSLRLRLGMCRAPFSFARTSHGAGRDALDFPAAPPPRLHSLDAAVVVESGAFLHTVAPQMVLQSPDLSDETFVYIRRPNEHQLILGVLDTPLVHGLQQKLFAALDREDTAGVCPLSCCPCSRAVAALCQCIATFL